MATVAVTYTIAPNSRTPEDVIRSLAPIRQSEPRTRPVPELKRVWASLEKPPESVIEEAFDEARFRDPDRNKSWVALVDGNKPQIKFPLKNARKQKVDLTIVLDFIHVSEYVWSAGLAFHAEATVELQAWVNERLLQILRGKSSEVAAGMRRSATLRELGAQTREAVDRCADYLLEYRTCGTTHTWTEDSPSPPASSKEPAGIWSKTVWTSPAPDGRCRARRPCYAFAHSARAVTSTNTGPSTNTSSTNETTPRSTPTPRHPP